MTVGRRVGPLKGLRRLGLSAALWVLLACDGGTGPGGRPLDVTISVARSSMEPGDTVRVTVQAVPARDVVVDAIVVRSTGLLAVAESVSAPGTGMQQARWLFPLPFRVGHVAFIGEARAGQLVATDTVRVSVGDSVRPELTQAGLAPTDKVNLGTQFIVAFEAEDNCCIARTIVRWSGALTGVDSAEHPFPRSLVRAVTVPVPFSTPLEDSISVTVSVMDAAGNVNLQSLPSIRTADLTPPSVTGTVTAPPTTVPGDTVEIAVNARDGAGVRWVGYRRGIPATLGDSIAVSDTLTSHVFQAIVTRSWIGSDHLAVFARDAGANEDELYEGVFAVVDATRRPVETVRLGGEGPVTDVAYDGKRHRLYFSLPYDTSVAVVALQPAQLMGAIRLNQSPRGVDLTPGADTLVVALSGTPYLGIVDLTQPVTTVDTVRLTGVPIYGPGVGPDRVRVLANGKAFVTTSDYGSQSGVWEYNLATGSSGQRTDLVGAGNFTYYTPLARSWDGRRMLVQRDLACCPVGGMVYDVSGDAFTSEKPTVSYSLAKASSDSTGTRFLIASELFDGSLTKLAVFDPPDAAPNSGAAISPDGLNAYLATAFGYVKVRLADGEVLERVALPESSNIDRLVALPSEQILVVVRWTTVDLVHVQ